MTQICIKTDRTEILAELDDSPTTRAVLDILPCTSSASTWGEEVYFSIPVNTQLEADAVQVVPPGTVCFWVEGNSVALPYGPTPIAEKDECRLISKVNILGKIIGNPRQLANISPGDEITMALI